MMPNGGKFPNFKLIFFNIFLIISFPKIDLDILGYSGILLGSRKRYCNILHDHLRPDVNILWHQQYNIIITC